MDVYTKTTEGDVKRCHLSKPTPEAQLKKRGAAVGLRDRASSTFQESKSQAAGGGDAEDIGKGGEAQS